MTTVVRFFAVAGAASALFIGTCGVSAASSDPLAGKTYKDAAAQVTGWGGHPVIGTVFGDRLASDDCIVDSSHKASFTDIGGKKRNGVYLLNLNCNDAIASAGSPGNSIASPEGKQAAKNIKTAKWCSEPAQADYADCATFCTKHDGLCTANF